MLHELHDKAGERIARLVHAEGAMVTSGAAAALTLGTAATLTGTDGQKIVDLPSLAGMKSEVIVHKIASLRLRPCRSPEAPPPSRLVRRTGRREWAHVV